MSDAHDDDEDRHNRGRRQRDSWRIGREFPVPLMLTMLVQAAAIIWFFAGQAAELRTLGVKVQAIETKIDAVGAKVDQAAVPSALTASRLDFMESRINEMRAGQQENSRRIGSLELKSSASRER